MASISSIGVGSGLPLAELLQNLRASEEAPLNVLATRKASFSSKLSAYGVLKNSVEALQKAAEKLADVQSFTSLKATSSNTNALTATVAPGSGTAAGTYSVEVLQLATRQSLSAIGLSSRTDAVGSGGVLNVTVGGETKTLELADTSLDGLRAAINAADLGVTATIVNDGSGANPYRLVLSANSSGEAARVTSISVDGNVDLAGILSFGTGSTSPTPMQETAAAQDAKIRLNGLEVSSATNTLTEAIEGVSLQLLAPTATGAPLTLEVEQDQEVAVAAVKAYVDAYNSLQSTISRLTAYDVEAQKASDLTGDTTARSLQSQTRTMLTDTLRSTGLASFKVVGLNVTLEGRLELDEAAFKKALSEEPDTIVSFFTGEDGLAQNTQTLADWYVREKGAFESVTKGIEASIKDVERQYAQMEIRIEDNMARYQAQFAALDVLVNQLQATSSYLSQQLSMLNNNSSNRN